MKNGGEIQVRWTKQDRRDDLPGRFKRAMERSGAKQATLLRRLVLCYTLHIEKTKETYVEAAAHTIAEQDLKRLKKP